MQKHIDDGGGGDSVMMVLEPYGAKLVHYMLSKEKCKSPMYQLSSSVSVPVKALNHNGTSKVVHMLIPRSHPCVVISHVIVNNVCLVV